MTAARTDIFTVSKLNKFAKHILEAEIGQIWLSGEISNFVAASSGHWYFTLKDDKAQIKGAMFRGANRNVVNRPKEGDHVLIRGNVSLYEARGDYQLIVSHLEPEGVGKLKQQFEWLKNKLASEGLFSQSHKSPVPNNAKRVGIITSSSGAALHDVLTVMQRRSPNTEVVIYPTQVQGAEAPSQLQSALQVAISRNEVDVLLITRGGGSLEDLWCFNDENLARSIFNCPIPIVSAVGHEIDFTICDFVADMRAPTPSAAAEQLTTSREETLERLRYQEHKLLQLIQSVFRHKNQHIQIGEGRLKQVHPSRQLQQQWQSIDSIHMRLNKCMENKLTESRHQLQICQGRIASLSPAKTLQTEQKNLSNLEERLKGKILSKIKDAQSRYHHLGQLLDTVSPLRTMTRGYSITSKEGEIITDATTLTLGEVISTRLHKGTVASKIIAIK